MTGGPRGCSVCEYICGALKRKENGGPCTGCDQFGLNCEKCDDANCIRCRPDNKAVCSRCENGYSLKGDKCVPNCGLGYYQLIMKNGFKMYSM